MALALIASAPQAGAGSLEALSGVVGGAGNGSIQNGCTTYGAPAELGGFFGTAPLPMQVLGGNAACGYSGGWTNLQLPGAAAGTVLNNTASLTPVILGNPSFAGFYDGTTDARAGYGSLGARAHGNFSSGLPGTTTALFYAMSAALFGDTLTASSPLVANLSAGSVQYVFHLEGSASAPGAQAPFFFGDARAQLWYQHQGGPVFGPTAAVDATRGSVGTVDFGPLPAGWTASTGLSAAAATSSA